MFSMDDACKHMPYVVTGAPHETHYDRWYYDITASEENGKDIAGVDLREGVNAAGRPCCHLN